MHKRSFIRLLSPKRIYSNQACSNQRKKTGLVLGAYETCSGELTLSPCGSRVDEEAGGAIANLLKGLILNIGDVVVFSRVVPDFRDVAIAGVGIQGLGYNELESIDECKENIRIASGMGSLALQNRGINEIHVEGFSNPEAAAEGSVLSVWKYQDLKYELNKTTEASVEAYGVHDMDEWQKGLVKAEAQNVARKLEETPHNLMRPEDFVQAAINILCPCGVQVDARDRDWLTQKYLGAFLCVARASGDPPYLVEMQYCGGNKDDKPIILVGMGLTFDSGGILLNKVRTRANNLPELRSDLAGAAVVVGVMKAIARLNLPINVIGLVPLCSNMPGGMAMRTTDVAMALNGRTIKIKDTNAGGRVMLADIMCYSGYFNPCIVMSLATASEGMRHVLGSSASGVFATSDLVWREIQRAGADTGDRVWRFPVWQHFNRKIKAAKDVDIWNAADTPHGDPCVAASFLLSFAPDVDFVHIDITGTGMVSTGTSHPYLRENLMTGRPTRTIVQFLYQLACPHDSRSEC